MMDSASPILFSASAACAAGVPGSLRAADFVVLRRALPGGDLVSHFVRHGEAEVGEFRPGSPHPDSQPEVERGEPEKTKTNVVREHHGSVRI